MFLFHVIAVILLIDGLNCNKDCRQTKLGTDYRGSTSTTISGFTCQRWDSQKPHKHTRSNVKKFPNAKFNKENYCRNPDNERGTGPWCYTTNPDVRWESCGIELCGDCKFTERGIEYRGTLSKTKSGRTCQAWTSQSPHKHNRNNVKKFPDAKFNEKNYCRNPDHTSKGPWCYTTDPKKRWEHCDIPICEDDCKKSPKGKDYSGEQTTTLSGLTCQRWDSQTPHKHKHFGSVANADNYCRNPDGVYSGPWCYTTNPFIRWETCGLPICPNA